MSTPWRLATHPAELSITLHDPSADPATRTASDDSWSNHRPCP